MTDGPPRFSCTMSAAAALPPVCYVSRTRGWVGSDGQPRSASSANLLAVAIGRPVWTTGTAWESIFHHPMPRRLSEAYWRSMVRARLTEPDLEQLRWAAARLGVRLVELP